MLGVGSPRLCQLCPLVLLLTREQALVFRPSSAYLSGYLVRAISLHPAHQGDSLTPSGCGSIPGHMSLVRALPLCLWLFGFCSAVRLGRVYTAFGRKTNFRIEVRIENGFPH